MSGFRLARQRSKNVRLENSAQNQKTWGTLEANNSEKNWQWLFSLFPWPSSMLRKKTLVPSNIFSFSPVWKQSPSPESLQLIELWGWWREPWCRSSWRQLCHNRADVSGFLWFFTHDWLWWFYERWCLTCLMRLFDQSFSVLFLWVGVLVSICGLLWAFRRICG